MSQKLLELFGLSPGAPHFEEALSHPSYANEQGLPRHNQRLEFLGDAVLGLCVTELLFERFPSADEGVLTSIRAQLVNTDALADFVEALIGATYLDGGPASARSVCQRFVEPRLEQLALERNRLDPKTELQQRVQALGGTAPTYAVIDSGGPAHDRWFQVRVRLGDRWGAEGRGRSKRLAEREAARVTLLENQWAPAIGVAVSSVVSADASSEETE
jgi:ribonuclease-3